MIIPGPISPFYSISSKNWPERAQIDILQLLLRELSAQKNININKLYEKCDEDNVISGSVTCLHDLWILQRCDRAPSLQIIMISRLTIPDIKINISLTILMMII